MRDHPLRHFVIGDIHGHITALDAILNVISPTASDRITFLGDYVDHGPESKAVLDTLIGLGSIAFSMAGNHERYLLAAYSDAAVEREWLRHGGLHTLDSFAANHARDLPRHYIDWLAELPWYTETAMHVFVHAGINPNVPLHMNNEEDLLWKHQPQPYTLKSGKTLVCGHTPCKQAQILPGYICLDTNIANGGVLTCLNLQTMETWSADCTGKLTHEHRCSGLGIAA